MALSSLGALSGLTTASRRALAGASASLPVSRGRAPLCAVVSAEQHVNTTNRPVPPSPQGTPQGVSLDLPQRPRRNRRSPTIRGAFREVCPAFCKLAKQDRM